MTAVSARASGPAWPVLGLVLLAACGVEASSPLSVAEEREAATPCEFCSATGDEHTTFRQGIDWLEDLEPAQRAAVREGLAAEGVAIESETSVCPRAFGAPPAPGEALLVPLATESGPDDWRRSWAVVGRDPWAWSYLEAFRAVLGDVQRPGDTTFSAGSDRVWLLELRVERRVQDDGRPAARYSLSLAASNGMSRTSTGGSEWIQQTPGLEQLALATSARLRVSFPSRTVLAVVDGNPITLDLREEGSPQDGEGAAATTGSDDAQRFRYPWHERRYERVRAGERASPVF